MIQRAMKEPRSNQNELERLVSENYGLLVSQALSFNPKDKDQLEEYIQTGSIGMIKAIRTYNPEKGELSTHICCCVKNAIRTYIRHEKRQLKTKEITEEAYEHNFESINDYLTDSNELDNLILEMRLGRYTIREIAERVGCDLNQAKHLINKIVKKIKKHEET